MNENIYHNDDEKWLAVKARDKLADGRFYFAVATTGIYCRPSCGARQPKRENVSFFSDVASAEKAGFRACKRCQPNQQQSWNKNQELVTTACRYIESAETPPTLKQLAAKVGLSEYHFHRIFKEATGVTPKAYANSVRAKNVKDSLRTADTVTEAIYDAGYGASSRFYEKSQSFLGMTPQQFKAGGQGHTVHYTIVPCYLGLVLVAATDKGICSIQFADDRAELEALLKQTFPNAMLDGGDETFATLVANAVAYIENGNKAHQDLPLDIMGTAFQQQVWQAIMQIPSGSTLSYKKLAESMNKPTAARAVASACAKNNIAVVIPCHRVVRGDGSLSGYRWGVERKAKLLAKEKA